MKLKAWWLNLTKREQQTLSIGSIVVGLFLIYELIWSPLSNGLENLRHSIISDQKILQWMQASDKHMQLLEKALEKHTLAPTVTLLGIMQKQIENSAFSKDAVVLQQVENNAVHLTLQKVDFDTFISWLIQLWQQQGILIKQINIVANGRVGLVNADIVFAINS